MAAPMLSGNALVDALMSVQEHGASRKQVKDILESLAFVVQNEISKGNRVRIPNVGTVEIRFRSGIKKGTMVRNPSTGEKVKHPGKPASTKIGFRALKDLNDSLPTPPKAKAALKRG